MGEMKGFIFSTAMFIALIVPFFLTITVGSIHQQGFMKVTTEFREIVKEEGGVTNNVNYVKQELNKKGYTITLKDTNGKVINGKANVGDTIIIDYRYQYQDVKGPQTLQTQNSVIVTRR